MSIWSATPEPVWLGWLVGGSFVCLVVVRRDFWTRDSSNTSSYPAPSPTCCSCRTRSHDNQPVTVFLFWDSFSSHRMAWEPIQTWSVCVHVGMWAAAVNKMCILILSQRSMARAGQAGRDWLELGILSSWTFIQPQSTDNDIKHTESWQQKLQQQVSRPKMQRNCVCFWSGGWVGWWWWWLARNFIKI